MCSSHSYAQSRIKLELTTGPHQGYQKFLHDPSPSMDLTTPIGSHFGIGLLYRIREDWQMALHSQSFGLPFRYTLHPETSRHTLYPHSRRLSFNYSFRNVGLGVRKTWERGDQAFYFQPSLGINLSREFVRNIQDSILLNPAFVHRTNVVPTATLEVGMKFYTQSQNYFTVGLRHQQGFGMLNEFLVAVVDDAPNPLVQRGGSYTGLVLGYGIDFRSRSKRDKEEWKTIKKERKSEKRRAAWGDGAYVMLPISWRFQPGYERDATRPSSRIRSASHFLAGYTTGPWSFETGISSWMSNTSIDSENYGPISLSNPRNRAIPLRARYHLDIGDKNRLRIGASAAAFFTLNSSMANVYERGRFMLDGEQVPFFLAYPSSEASWGKLLYQAGVFVDIPFFNSSMISFNFNQNFGSPDIGLMTVEEIVDGNRINYTAGGTLNGFNIELGLKIPFSTWTK